jgi:hypothetical protein
MAEQYILWNDIIDNHGQRMYNLKKYYPFFKLQDTTFAQYKEGRYSDLDMGYITLATLRFFIDENNFNERRVTFGNYEQFLSTLLRRDFELDIDAQEMQELVVYIFDKIKNDGKPFYFHYFDPKDKKRKTSRMKLVESEIEDGSIFYHITADGVEFYLETKEVHDESEISIQQILLEKMIHANNFKGGIEVVKRINSEVAKMAMKKREVIAVLETDVYEGAQAVRQYMNRVARWFDEEEKLFDKNRELIAVALAQAQTDAGIFDDGRNKYFKVLEDIYELETELKKTIERHAQLISETMELNKVADRIIEKAKLKRLRPIFDFNKQLRVIQDADDASLLGVLLEPLLKPNVKKTFALTNLDRMLSNRPESGAAREKTAVQAEPDDYVYPDEVEEQRISDNFKQLAMELFEQVLKKHEITLRELNAIYEIKFGTDIFRNGDYYTFLVHLCQKSTYLVGDMFKKQDTFLDGIVANTFARAQRERYERLSFVLEWQDDDELVAAPNCTVSNILFRRTDIG